MKPENRYNTYITACVSNHRKPASFDEWCKYHNISDEKKWPK